jgi:hypothetical protein
MPFIVGQLTLDGNPIGDPIRVPGGANDVHLEFERGTEQDKTVTVEFTKDGKTVGKPVNAPEGATDVGLDFERGGSHVWRVYWTKKGEIMKGQHTNAPKDANDVHIKLPKTGSFTKAWWTHNNEKLKDESAEIPIPREGANDFHFGHDEYFPWSTETSKVETRNRQRRGTTGARSRSRRR